MVKNVLIRILSFPLIILLFIFVGVVLLVSRLYPPLLEWFYSEEYEGDYYL
jgi:hypothetical protein